MVGTLGYTIRHHLISLNMSFGYQIVKSDHRFRRGISIWPLQGTSFGGLRVFSTFCARTGSSVSRYLSFAICFLLASNWNNMGKSEIKLSLTHIQYGQYVVRKRSGEGRRRHYCRRPLYLHPRHAETVVPSGRRPALSFTGCRVIWALCGRRGVLVMCNGGVWDGFTRFDMLALG